jgi:hypothetical protein
MSNLKLFRESIQNIFKEADNFDGESIEDTLNTEPQAPEGALEGAPEGVEDDSKQTITLTKALLKSLLDLAAGKPGTEPIEGEDEGEEMGEITPEVAPEVEPEIAALGDIKEEMEPEVEVAPEVAPEVEPEMPGAESEIAPEGDLDGITPVNTDAAIDKLFELLTTKEDGVLDVDVLPEIEKAVFGGDDIVEIPDAEVPVDDAPAPAPKAAPVKADKKEKPI